MSKKYENNRLKTGLVSAAVLCVGATMSVLAGPANADPSASAEGQPEKVFVCKYVGTPFVDERLQGSADNPNENNPIEVSVNAIPIYTGQVASDLIGEEFADGQGRSIVIAVSAVRGGGQGDEPTIEDCPAPEGPPEEPVTVTGTPTLTDQCEPGNEVLSTPPANVIFTPVDMGTFIQVTVSAAAGYALDQAQTVFDLPVNDEACPTNPVIVKTQGQECVGNALVTTFFENGVNVGSETVDGAEECETEDNEILGEEASNNNNSGGNGGGTTEVLGAQAAANNAPAAAAQQSAPASSAAQVPTVINAGTAGEAPANPLGSPAAIALFGALMGLIALGMRGGLARVGGGKA